ncbi:hypothetical protein EDD16DRAFT_1762510 [Pisolithus croceorrhizus]|nr:hypothetical protein EDD16DRAFT_1762510 [Pisolithus croceorrhizus]KAI6106970.1 hypothetical protein EV401DRAFT_1892261 [Pisolithus croceorrhizus]KAI6158419.1 hypothetical protein EDD17DRAFT_1899426 [Pisolithus thermaeus]
MTGSIHKVSLFRKMSRVTVMSRCECLSRPPATAASGRKQDKYLFVDSTIRGKMSTGYANVRQETCLERCTLTEYGWAQSFYFSGFYKGKGFAASLVRRQHYPAVQMGLRPGVRVLDVESGVGTLAPEIALYGVAATIHAPTWEGVYGEIFKVPKPGSVASVVPTSRYSLTSPTTQFGVYEWCMTDAWDSSIPSHRKLAHQIEIGSGMLELRLMKLARQAMRNVGFQIDHEEDPADSPDKISWH